MEHLLQIIFDTDCISWYYIYTFHFCCCHYVCFCVYDNFSWSSHLKKIVWLITSLTLYLITFPTAMMLLWCFIEVYLSIRKSTLRVYHIVVFGTPNPSRSSEYLDFTIILFHRIHSALIQCVTGFWVM